MRERYDFPLRGEATYSAGAVSDGSFTMQNITVGGVVMGDFAFASFSTDITDLQLDANVTDANTVTITFYNHTGGSVTPSGTIYVHIDKK